MAILRLQENVHIPKFIYILILEFDPGELEAVEGWYGDPTKPFSNLKPDKQDLARHFYFTRGYTTQNWPTALLATLLDNFHESLWQVLIPMTCSISLNHISLLSGLGNT